MKKITIAAKMRTLATQYKNITLVYKQSDFPEIEDDGIRVSHHKQEVASIQIYAGGRAFGVTLCHSDGTLTFLAPSRLLEDAMQQVAVRCNIQKAGR